LLDRAAERVDLNRPDGRRAFIGQMLTVAATIPDAAARDQFADRLAHKARITESVVRDEIRKAAAAKKTEPPAVSLPSSVRMLDAEQGLLWALVNRPVEGLAALAQLEADDEVGLISAPVFALARSLAEMPADVLPELLRERLSEGERALVARAAAREAAAPPSDCVHALKRRRLERERAEVQNEIDRLQAGTRAGANTDQRLADLWAKKLELLQRLEALKE
jgi:DNA primase